MFEKEKACKKGTFSHRKIVEITSVEEKLVVMVGVKKNLIRFW